MQYLKENIEKTVKKTIEDHEAEYHRKKLMEKDIEDKGISKNLFSQELKQGISDSNIGKYHQTKCCHWRMYRKSSA